MTKSIDYELEITPEVLLKAYACGIFPMAEAQDDPNLYWIEPTQRGILPLDEFHIPRRLARTVRSNRFHVRVDTDFDGVIDGCAAQAPRRRSTWINGKIRRLYGALFEAGRVHTVEAWRGGTLVGGLYGVTLGAAFFGESMFARERDASKVALVHLVARLKRGGFHLLDTQFNTPHLERFGVREIPREHYQRLLSRAVEEQADFYCWEGEGASGEPAEVDGKLLLQSISQTS